MTDTSATGSYGAFGRHTRKGMIIMAVTAGAAVAACAPATTAETSPSGAAHYSAIADDIAEYAMSIADDAGVPAVVIGVITADGLAEERFVGANHSGETVTSKTLFEIGSATKAFLGVTEAMLVDQGELLWNDPVVDHYPDFEMRDPWVTEQFRIDDLLAQRSGLLESASELPYAFGLPWSANVDGLKYLRPVSSFRSEFAYQNIPHFVAGEIVADKVGVESWNDAAVQMIFEPLEMHHTSASVDALTQSHDTTRGHTMSDGVPHERPLEEFPSVAQGAGSIVSNLEDMSKWVAMHLSHGAGPNGQLVSAEQLQRTYAPLVSVTQPSMTERVRHSEAETPIGYATGWFVHSLPEGRIIEHGGNTQGYNSAITFDPDRGVGLVVLSNQGHLGGPATHIAKYGMDLLQGRTPLPYFERWKQFQQQSDATAQAEPQHDSGHEAPIEHYVGVYEHELLGALAIVESGETLRTTVGPHGYAATLERIAGHEFEMRWDRAEPHGGTTTGVVTFDGAGVRPGHLSIEGFEFVRTP